MSQRIRILSTRQSLRQYTESWKFFGSPPMILGAECIMKGIVRISPENRIRSYENVQHTSQKKGMWHNFQGHAARYNGAFDAIRSATSRFWSHLQNIWTLDYPSMIFQCDTYTIIITYHNPKYWTARTISYNKGWHENRCMGGLISASQWSTVAGRDITNGPVEGEIFDGPMKW